MQLHRFCKIIVVLFLLVLPSCLQTTDKVQNEDLIKGQEAYAQYEISDAEMYFQRFLRKNPFAQERWDVWQKLLNISMNIRQEKTTAVAYLEIMLEEFGDNPKRKLGIELELASLSSALHNNDRAVELWENIIEDPITAPEEKATVYRNLSYAYLTRMEFVTASNALQACLELDVSPSVKGNCLYDMAEAQILTDNLALAETHIQTLLYMGGIPKDRLILARFMLGDIKEQQGHYAEALAQFRQIQYTFPNPKVMEVRISYLEKKLKKK